MLYLCNILVNVHFDILPTKQRPVKIKDENYFTISEESEDNIIII